MLIYNSSTLLMQQIIFTRKSHYYYYTFIFKSCKNFKIALQNKISMILVFTFYHAFTLLEILYFHMSFKLLFTFFSFHSRNSLHYLLWVRTSGNKLLQILFCSKYLNFSFISERQFCKIQYIIFGLLFFSFRTLKVSPTVFYTVSFLLRNTLMILLQIPVHDESQYFFCFQDSLLVFIFWQFEYNIS